MVVARKRVGANLDSGFWTGLWTGLDCGLSFGLNYPRASWQQDIMASVPAPPFDLCVARVRNAACFGMPLGFLEHLRRNNLPTIISTFHVSELWILTLFPQALLFHLMCCHCWTKFMKKSCVLFLDSFTWYCLYFSAMFCYNCSQFVVQFIVAFLINFRCSKTVMKAI